MAKTRRETIDSIYTSTTQMINILSFLKEQNLSEHSQIIRTLEEMIDAIIDPDYADIIRHLNDEDYEAYGNLVEQMAICLVSTIAGSKSGEADYQKLPAGVPDNYALFIRDFFPIIMGELIGQLVALINSIHLPEMSDRNKQIFDGALKVAGGTIAWAIVLTSGGTGAVLAVWGTKEIMDGIAEIALATADIDYNGLLPTVVGQVAKDMNADEETVERWIAGADIFESAVSYAISPPTAIPRALKILSKTDDVITGIGTAQDVIDFVRNTSKTENAH